jgi:lycopene beta-cyclase
MTVNQQFDYIIAGTGCAGLSMALQLKNSGVNFSKVLLIDKDLKNKNDRTWCFWTKEKNNWFDDLVFRKWNNFHFKSNSFEKAFDISPYQYMMIKGIDFYNYCFSELKKDPRFEFVLDEIKSISSENNLGVLNTETTSYQSPYIFNSSIRTQKIKSNHINYIQHFKGWVITTPNEVFDTEHPTFMDFRVDQYNDCRFFYVIPFSKTSALIEYTGFSENSLSPQQYDTEIINYIKNYLNIEYYKIEESEYGEIPMAESEFINPFGANVINIGTAGGFSKPSTGYTFYFIQKNVKYLISQLEKGIKLSSNTPRELRFYNYDKVFLEVMHSKKIASSDVFTQLFKNNSIETLLAFLNEETNYWEDLIIMNSVPKQYFIPAFFKKNMGF